LALGLGHLLKHGVEETLQHWTRAVGLDVENHYVQKLIMAGTGISRRRMQVLRLGTLLYGALFCVEGTGLLMRKRWAEYVTIISTAGFLPVEGYELIHRFSAVKTAVAVLNVIVVIYLIVQLCRGDGAAEPLTLSASATPSGGNA
jgi:uncharacterized membrane protein (DUF2068 family)